MDRLFQYKKFDKIGPFEVVNPVKMGSYAESYIVEAPDESRYFLKLLEYSVMQPAQFDEKDNPIELMVSRKLHNDDLLRLHGYGGFIQDGKKKAYIVYNLIDGITLTEWLKDNKASTRDIISIANGVLKGLQYIHSLDVPVLHNNITPDNVMVYEDLFGFHAKLIDFGHATFEDEKYLFFEHAGNDIFYLAPESFNGESTVESDLYSVGALLYQLIFNTVPYYCERDAATANDDVWKEKVYSEKKHPVKIPALSVPDIKPEMIDVIRTALDVSPISRFGSAEEFIAAVENAQKGLPITKSVSSPKTAFTGFAAIAGMEQLKEQLQNDVIDVLRDSERAQSLGLDIPNGMLLYGPPGCGKTFFAEKFAEELGCNYVYVKCSDVASQYIHGGQEKIAAIFKEAREKSPTILFLDEVDAMIMDREFQHNPSEAGEVNEFLAQMNNCGKDGVLVIAATNNPTKIDRAALRAGRLDLKYYIGNPDLESRKALFSINLRKRAVQGYIDIDKLAEQTEGYASVDIKTIVDNAGRYVFKTKRAAITMEDLEYGLAHTKSSLSPEQLARFEGIHRAFENVRPRRIGF